MPNRTIEDRVRELICDQLGVNEDQVESDTKFREDLHTDSLDDVELVMAMEEEFEIDAPDEDVEKLQTVGDVVAYITKKKTGVE